MENMFSAAKEYSIRRILETPLRTAPFPHLVVEEVFPPAFYAEMQRFMMEDADYMRLVDTGRVGANYSPARLCFVPPKPDIPRADSKAVKFWMTLFAAFNDIAFLQAWRTAFQEGISERARQDPTLFPSNKVNVKAEFLLMRDREKYLLNPHTDTRAKIISGLFYLPPNADAADLGTSLYELKDKSRAIEGGTHTARDGFNLVGTVPFRPNTLLAFPNLKDSYHGVEPVSGPGRQRDLLLYDIKLDTAKLPTAPSV